MKTALIVTTKTCTKCGLVKPLEDFKTDNAKPLGKASTCKSCESVRKKKYNSANKEKIAEYDRNRRQNDLFRARVRDIWSDMMGRCYRPSHKSYKWYGEMGVEVCKSWHDFECYYNWFIKNMPDDYSGKKYHVDKDKICKERGISPHFYSPETCKFILTTENVN